jgi:DNA-binding NarL/FixJ family response regulator
VGKQTYLCNVCYRRFTLNAKHVFRPKHIKEQAIRLFVNGMSINAIAKALNIPFPTVYKWIKKAGKKAEITFLHKLRALKQRGKVKAISIDEAWSFAGKKENDIWIWSVVVEYFDGRTEKYLFAGKRDLETF